VGFDIIKEKMTTATR